MRTHTRETEWEPKTIVLQDPVASDEMHGQRITTRAVDSFWITHETTITDLLTYQTQVAERYFSVAEADRGHSRWVDVLRHEASICPLSLS